MSQLRSTRHLFYHVLFFTTVFHCYVTRFRSLRGESLEKKCMIQETHVDQYIKPKRQFASHACHISLLTRRYTFMRVKFSWDNIEDIFHIWHFANAHWLAFHIDGFIVNWKTSFVNFRHALFDMQLAYDFSLETGRSDDVQRGSPIVNGMYAELSVY